MSHARYLVGDVFERMAELPDGSVDLVLTSPPFLALRSYLPADHPDKGKEIGSEATPAAFVDTLLRLSAEWRRVLAPHGSIAVELGDTYSGSGGAGGDYGENGLREGQPTFRQRTDGGQYGYWPQGGTKHNVELRPVKGSDGWPLAKSKTLIPELYRIALAYGIHPLTGQPSPAGAWRIRNVVTWCRPNPPVGALGDKWRPATSDIVVACVSGKRYWDDVATRRPLSADPHGLTRTRVNEKHQDENRQDDPKRLGAYTHGMTNGAPLLDYWEIPPGGYPGSHYAVYPPALIEPLIKAMAPPKVCVECGEPSRRITETTNVAGVGYVFNGSHGRAMPNAARSGDKASQPSHAEKVTTGWTDCGHNAWRPALILDPFAGSGTTLTVATGHGHDAIGIDIDERNAKLAEERIGGLFLTVEGETWISSSLLS